MEPSLADLESYDQPTTVGPPPTLPTEVGRGADLYGPPPTPTDVRGGPDIPAVRPALAPDFVRDIPNASIEADSLQAKAEELTAGPRQAVWDKWAELQQADLVGRAQSILGEAAAGAGVSLDTFAADALSKLPVEVTTGGRTLAPWEIPGVFAGSPLQQATNELTWKLGEGIHAINPGIPTEAGAFAAGFLIPGFGGKAKAGEAALVADPILAAYNRVPELAPGALGQAKGVFSAMERLISDRFVAVNKVSPEAEALQSVFAGRTGGAYWNAVNAMGPVYRAIGDEAVTLASGLESTTEHQLNKLIGLQTYIEAAAAKFNPDRFNPAGVANMKEAQAALKAMETDVGPDVWARIQQADDLRVQAARALLENKVQAGLVPRALADKLNEMFPHYNPTVITHYLDDAVAGGGSVRQMTNTLKRLTAEGSESEQLPPLQAMLKNLMDGDLAIRRNTLISTVVQDGGFPVAVARKFSTGPEIKRTTEIGFPSAIEDWTARRDAARDAGETMRDWYEANPRPASPLATVVQNAAIPNRGKALFMRDGKLVEADLPKDLADALGRISTENLGRLAEITSGLNRSLRVGATQLNPAFLGANAFRDYTSAFVREGLLPPEVLQGYGESIVHGPLWQLAQRAGGGFGAEGGYFARGVKYQPGETAGEITRNLAALEQKVKEDGGAILKTPKDLTQFLDAVGSGDIAAVAKYFTNPLRFGPGAVRDIGEAVEYGPRIATFAKHLEPAFEAAVGRKAANWNELAEWGSTQPVAALAEAGMAMRRVTVDFSRAGELVRSLNAAAPFLNARVQGALTMGRTLRDDPAARLRAGAIGAVAAGLYLYNRQFPEFKDVPDYLANNGFQAVMLPGSEPNPNGLGYKAVHFISFPLGEYGTFATAVTEAMKAAEGTSGGLLDAMSKVVNAANPLPGAEGAAGLVPAPLRAYGEMQANYDSFRGRPIESESMKGLLPELRATPRTPELAKRLSEFLADKPVPDMLKSPVMLEHLINTTTGGGGRLATQAISTAMGQESDRPLVLGGLTSTIYRTYGGEIERKAYADRDQALGDLRNQYRPMLKAFEENVGSGAITQPPSEIEQVPLLPADQVIYERARLETLQQLFTKADIDRTLADKPVLVRKEVLNELLSAAGEVATALTIMQIPPDEVRRRVQLKQQPNERKALPRQEYQPVGVR